MVTQPYRTIVMPNMLRKLAHTIAAPKTYSIYLITCKMLLAGLFLHSIAFSFIQQINNK